MRKWGSFVAAVLIALSSANADEPTQIYGAGIRSCAEFARAYAAKPSFTEDAYFLWAQGFWSGLNAAYLAYKMPYRLLNTDMAAQKAQLRSYCDAHPLLPYYAAAAEVYNRLPAAH